MKIRSDIKDTHLIYALREARQSSGYTLKDVASVAGVTLWAVHSYERLRRMPSQKIAEKIAIFFGKPVTKLFPQDLKSYIRGIAQERKGEYFDPLRNAVPLGSATKNLVDDEGISPVDVAILWEKTAAIRHVVNGLESRLQQVIKLRYGIPDGNKYTLEEIGKILNITGERVRQIEKVAIKKLQDHRKMHLLESFVQ
ncbi:MAG: sigma factor-like helix-turn-helix DNA-binding protein [Nanoarchaeota archaeon]|nr:sigma factor-like helix-turn-helix DNA-binding protein [Nanoarchaeota archaeon]